MAYWNDIDEMLTRFDIGDRSLNGYEHNVLFRNDGSKFTEIGFVTGCDSVYDGRSVVAGDLDNDGDIDLITTSLSQPAQVFENHLANQNGWIQVRLDGTSLKNRSAVGSRIKISAAGRQQMKEVHVGSSFLSQQSPYTHFGLGKAASIDQLEVRWPIARNSSGKLQFKRQIYYDVPINGILTLKEGTNQYNFQKSKSTPSQPATPEPSVQDPELLSLKGKPIRLADFKGKVLVANFWATWCEPCKDEIPELMKVHAYWQEKGVKVIGITHEKTTPERVAQDVWEHQINYPIYLANRKRLKQFGEVSKIPTTIIFDEEGREKFRHSGKINFDDLSVVLSKITTNKK